VKNFDKQTPVMDVIEIMAPETEGGSAKSRDNSPGTATEQAYAVLT